MKGLILEMIVTLRSQLMKWIKKMFN